ncbi:MAG TPA: FAD-dependent oxidoreductase, partial [Candidatus Limnocylindrales bacterium]|nr:FAD-dependent oxidoreductase [Candidatus Limnocylindrales bacterium]
MAGASRVAKRHGAGIMIAGAGIAGIATAFSLAERGIRDVVIVDPRPPLSLTSRRPETNYRLWWPLAARSLALVEALLADGAAVPMDRRGYLYVSDAEATARSLPAFVAGHPALVPAEA